MAFQFIYNTVAMAITYCFVLMNRAGRLECTDTTRYNFSGLSCPILTRRSILPESWSGDKDRGFVTVLPQRGPVVLFLSEYLPCGIRFNRTVGIVERRRQRKGA